MPRRLPHRGARAVPGVGWGAAPAGSGWGRAADGCGEASPQLPAPRSRRPSFPESPRAGRPAWDSFTPRLLSVLRSVLKWFTTRGVALHLRANLAVNSSLVLGILVTRRLACFLQEHAAPPTPHPPPITIKDIDLLALHRCAERLRAPQHLREMLRQPRGG